MSPRARFYAYVRQSPIPAGGPLQNCGVRSAKAATADLYMYSLKGLICVIRFERLCIINARVAYMSYTLSNVRSQKSPQGRNTSNRTVVLLAEIMYANAPPEGLRHTIRLN